MFNFNNYSISYRYSYSSRYSSSRLICMQLNNKKLSNLSNLFNNKNIYISWKLEINTDVIRKTAKAVFFIL